MNECASQVRMERDAKAGEGEEESYFCVEWGARRGVKSVLLGLVVYSGLLAPVPADSDVPLIRNQLRSAVFPPESDSPPARLLPSLAHLVDKLGKKAVANDDSPESLLGIVRDELHKAVATNDPFARAPTPDPTIPPPPAPHTESSERNGDSSGEATRKAEEHQMMSSQSGVGSTADTASNSGIIRNILLHPQNKTNKGRGRVLGSFTRDALDQLISRSKSTTKTRAEEAQGMSLVQQAQGGSGAELEDAAEQKEVGSSDSLWNEEAVLNYITQYLQQQQQHDSTGSGVQTSESTLASGGTPAPSETSTAPPSTTRSFPGLLKSILQLPSPATEKIVTDTHRHMDQSAKSFNVTTPDPTNSGDKSDSISLGPPESRRRLSDTRASLENVARKLGLTVDEFVGIRGVGSREIEEIEDWSSCLIKNAYLQDTNVSVPSQQAVPAESLLECRDLCLEGGVGSGVTTSEGSGVACSFFSYWPTKKMCSMVGEVGMLRRKAGVISGSSQCYTTPDPDKDDSEHWRRNLAAEDLGTAPDPLDTPNPSSSSRSLSKCYVAGVSIRGSIASSVDDVLSVEACHFECLERQKCQFFSYMQPFYKCYLYDEAFGTEEIPDFVSGPRNCVATDNGGGSSSGQTGVQSYYSNKATPDLSTGAGRVGSSLQLGPLVPPPSSPSAVMSQNPAASPSEGTAAASGQQAANKEILYDEAAGSGVDRNTVEGEGVGSSTRESHFGLLGRLIGEEGGGGLKSIFGGLLGHSSPGGEASNAARHLFNHLAGQGVGSSRTEGAKEIEGMGLANAANELPALLSSVKSWMSAGDTVMNTLPISDLVRLGYKMSNSRAWHRRFQNLGDKKEAASAPPLGVPNPEVSCMSEGMRCCVPRSAAPKYQNDPPKLNGVDNPRCIATYVSTEDQLCVTTKYDEQLCDTQTIETTTMFLYRNAMVMPNRNMNDAICECTISKEGGGSSSNGTEEGGSSDGTQSPSSLSPRIKSSAKWQYSLAAAEKEEEERERSQANVKRLSKAAKTALEFGEALTGGGSGVANPRGGAGAGAGSPGHFLHQLMTLADDVGDPSGGGGASAGGVLKEEEARQQSPSGAIFKQGGSGVTRNTNENDDELTSAIRDTVKMIADRMKERSELKNAGAGSGVGAGLRRLIGNSNIALPPPPLLQPVACTVWRRSCESDLHRLLFDPSCQPVKLIEGGCPVNKDIKYRYHYVEEGSGVEASPMHFSLDLPSALSKDALSLACDFVFIPPDEARHDNVYGHQRRVGSSGSGAFPLCDYSSMPSTADLAAAAAESGQGGGFYDMRKIDRLIEEASRNKDGWQEVRSRGPLLDILLQLFPEKAVAESLALTIMKLREALDEDVTAPTTTTSTGAAASVTPTSTAKAEKQTTITTTAFSEGERTRRLAARVISEMEREDAMKLLQSQEEEKRGSGPPEMKVTTTYFSLRPAVDAGEGKGLSVVFEIEQNNDRLGPRWARISRSDIIY